MDLDAKELEKNLNEMNNETMEDHKNSLIQNISVLGISLEKVKRVSEAYDKSYDHHVEEDKVEERETSLKFSEFFQNLGATAEN